MHRVGTEPQNTVVPGVQATHVVVLRDPKILDFLGMVVGCEYGAQILWFLGGMFRVAFRILKI